MMHLILDAMFRGRPQRILLALILSISSVILTAGCRTEQPTAEDTCKRWGSTKRPLKPGEKLKVVPPNCRLMSYRRDRIHEDSPISHITCRVCLEPRER
jgi:hypothetical protein